MRGAVVAGVLSGSWRRSLGAWDGDPQDLERVAPLLLAGGTAGLAKRRMPAGAPSSVIAPLQDAWHLQVLHDTVREQNLVRAFGRLADGGVRAVLGKGWGVARSYPEPGLRPYGDMDLYVAPCDFERARTALELAGEVGLAVDLHRGLAELDDRSEEEIDRRAQVHTVAGVAVRTFGPEDQLRLVCLHALRHGMIRPLWLCDVAALLETRPETFDWAGFLSGDALRTEWALGAIGLAHQVLGAHLDGVPPEIAARVRRLPRWIVPSLLGEWSKGRKPQGAREPMAARLRRPASLAAALRQRWPNAIEATVGMRGSFGRAPRLPYQLAFCVRRSARFLGPILTRRP